MKAWLRAVFLGWSSWLGASRPVAAQTCFADFALLGTAAPTNGCYRLTSSGASYSRGGMWSPQALTLAADFDLSFAVTQCGDADGVVFVLQSAAAGVGLGAEGGGLGYYQGGAFARSLGVELDLYVNAGAPYHDPPGPHLMLALNGNPAAVVGPVAALALGNCAAHALRVRWDHAAHRLTVQLDGTVVLTYPQDVVATVFGGNPAVRFGFTGATGAVTATQLVCPGPLVATAVAALVADGPTVLCPGGAVGLRVPGQPAGTAYAWTPAAGLSATSEAAVVAAPAATTTYRVRVTAPGGCQTTDSVRVAVQPRPTVTLSPRQVVCPGAAAVLRAVSAEAGTTHAWAPAEGLSTTAGETVVAAPAATTRYTVTTTGAGFCTRQDTVVVVVRPPLQIAVAAPPQTTPNSRTLLTATSPVPGVTFVWSPGTGLSATVGPTVTATPLVPTTYTVTATDPAGCTERASALVQPFLLPNVITPNGDGRNDTFEPLVSLAAVALQVFDRWGRLVFEQAAYRGGWGAAGLPAGTYYYCLRSGRGERWQGWVEVVR